MNSAVAALIGLALAIVLIIKKVSPVYALILGALTGGLASGAGLQGTVSTMIDGVKDITPAIIRIIAAGVLTGMLVKTGAAQRISLSIIRGLGPKNVYLALALSALILTSTGVFIDVAVITIAPIAIITGNRLGLSRAKLLLAMIGGGKCGNIISPNPNTIIAAENYGASLSEVMAAGLLPAVIGLIVTVFVIIPLMPEGEKLVPGTDSSENEEGLPGLAASLAGPLAAIALLALRPICGFAVDPLVALPAGGMVGILCTGAWRKTGECLQYGLSKMSGIAVLLVGTGTVAGIIKASAIKDVLISLLSGWESGAVLMAPLSGTLMCAASASTTAGATIASASFAQTIIAAGVSAVWAAAMTNAGSTVLDHLPHGSFFHATGGSVGMEMKDRLKLIPYESLVGLTLTICSVAACFLFGR
ncbi:MAG: GntP family permease [Candidatus Cryptobacteroides sp.]|nr:GntP family permease [Candidatus Cryptobacteroides sp.]